MLQHMGLAQHAARIENAILTVLREGKVRTGDLGGKATCSEYTQELIDHL